MFNAKRLAKAAIGCALLFGASNAASQINVFAEYQTPQGQFEIRPVPIAVETIQANRQIVLGHATVVAYVNVALAAEDPYFVRIVLDGALWRTDSNGALARLFTKQQPSWTPTLVEGGAGKNRLVYRLGGAVPIGTTVRSALSLDFYDHLTVLNTNPGDISITFSLHTDQFDAVEGKNALDTRYFGGTAVLMRKVKGLDVKVNPGETAVADVATRPFGFLWFVNKAGNRFNGGNTGTAGSGANASNVKLGYAQVALNADKPLDANDDNIRLVTVDDLLTSAGFSVAVEGDLSIGAFDLVRQTAMGTAPNITYEVPCPQKRGSSSSPATGNIGPPSRTDTTPRAQTVTVAPGMGGSNPSRTEIATRHHLCLEVDNAGADSNRTPIQEQEFKATITIPPTAQSRSADKVEGVIGKIVRNGTAVDLAELIASSTYNQLLIIVNRGPTAATYELGSFSTNAGSGVTVELSDAAKAMRANGQNQIPAGGQVALRVADLLKFTGGDDAARAGAVLTLNAAKGNIQVATTQVNLQDGSTDTVVYPAR